MQPRSPQTFFTMNRNDSSRCPLGNNRSCETARCTPPNPYNPHSDCSQHNISEHSSVCWTKPTSIGHSRFVLLLRKVQTKWLACNSDPHRFVVAAIPVQAGQ